MITFASIFSFVLILALVSATLFAMLTVCIAQNKNRVSVKVRSNRGVYHRSPDSFTD